MNNPGNQTDEAIDKVFAGLRHAEAPAGMESRILRTLEARSLEVRATVRPRSGWRKAAPAWILQSTPTTYITGGLALASLLVVIVFGRWTQRTQATPQQVASAPIATSTSHPSIILHPPSPDRALTQATRGVEASSGPRSQPLSEEDALAISEMLAPSKPAPPLPLTRQEKLLAEVMHQAGPEELASLRPDVRAKEMELSKAEFHDFFEPLPVKDNE
jgi:hypothetical protein